MNLHTFKEIDPVGWLARVEKICKVQEIHKFNQLQRVFMSMERKVMFWCNSRCQEDSSLNWVSLPSNLILRFETSYDCAVVEGFSTLKKKVQRERKKPHKKSEAIGGDTRKARRNG